MVRSVAGIALALALLTPLAPMTGAVEDPEGDQEVGYYPLHWDDPVWAPAPEGWYRYVDLLRADVTETVEAVVFEVEVAGQDAEGPETFPYGTYAFDFTFHGESRQVRLWWDLDAGLAWGTLRHQEGERWRADAGGPANPLEGADGWRFVLPKQDLRDSRFVPARAGDVLEGITVSAEAQKSSYTSPCAVFATATCFMARDNASAIGDVTLQLSPPGVGHLLLRTDNPLRASNGLATTYVFDLELRNLGDAPDDALIQLGPFPSDWQVHAPAVVALPGGASVPVPVAVSVPFRHEHGASVSVEVRAQSTRDPSIEAVQDITVLWTDIPQPSGHHRTLHLHAAEGWGWMNTLPEDQEAGNDPGVRTNSYSVYSALLGASDYELTYTFPLQPRLLLGLDFDMDRTVTGQLALSWDREAEASLTAALGLAGEATTPLATQEQSVTLKAGRTEVDLALALQTAADLVEPAMDENLELVLTLRYSTQREPGDLDSAPLPLVDTTDARLELPLFDFRPVLDEDLVAALRQVTLTPLTPLERPANPGGTVAFALAASNHGDKGATIAWEVHGPAADWASVSPAASAVPAGGNATVAVTVRVPTDTIEGQRGEVLLVGRDRADPDVQAFARLVAAVTLEPVPDGGAEAAELEEQANRGAAKTPLPGAAALAALAAALAVRGRTPSRR